MTVNEEILKSIDFVIFKIGLSCLYSSSFLFTKLLFNSFTCKASE